MTLDEIQDNFYDDYGETPTNTTFEPQLVLRYINDAYSIILNEVDWPEIKAEKIVNLPVTTLASAANIGDTTITVTSAANFVQGLTLVVYNNNVYEHCKITSVNYSTNVITIESALINSFAVSDKVSLANFFIPQNFGIESYSLQIVSTTNQEKTLMKRSRTRDFIYDNGYINQASTPSTYRLQGSDNSIIVSGAATTGTNTTTVVLAGPLGFVNNFFVDCLLVNTTRYRESRITAYDESTGTFTLENPITGQVATDNIVIYRKQNKVQVFPLPSVSAQIIIEYRLVPAKLSNLYDVPIISDNFHRLILYGALHLASIKDHDDAKANYYGGLAKNEIERARWQTTYHPDGNSGLNFGK